MVASVRGPVVIHFTVLNIGGGSYMPSTPDHTSGVVTLKSGQEARWAAIGYGSIKDRSAWTWGAPSEDTLAQHIADPDFQTLISINDDEQTFSIVGGYAPEDFIAAVEWYVEKYMSGTSE